MRQAGQIYRQSMQHKLCYAQSALWRKYTKDDFFFSLSDGIMQGLAATTLSLNPSTLTQANSLEHVVSMFESI